MRGADAREAIPHSGHSVLGNSQQQAALGAEALQQGSRSESGFFGDVDKCEPGRSNTGNDTGRGHEYVCIRSDFTAAHGSL